MRGSEAIVRVSNQDFGFQETFYVELKSDQDAGSPKICSGLSLAEEQQMHVRSTALFVCSHFQSGSDRKKIEPDTEHVMVECPKREAQIIGRRTIHGCRPASTYPKLGPNRNPTKEDADWKMG